MITFRGDQASCQPYPTRRKHLVVRRQDGEIVDLGTSTDSTMGIDPVIADDEPVLLITATDPLGAIVADFYADQIMARGGEKELVDAVIAHARRMRQYRDQNTPENALLAAVTTIGKGWLANG